MKSNFVDVAIVGAGVNGTALYYALCKHTRDTSVLLADKKSGIALGNSNPLSNSQTLHAGDIETNYSFKQALKLREGALSLKKYCLNLNNRDQVIFKMPKMVLAVGDQEINFLAKRYQQFKEGFTRLQWLDWNDIRHIEPHVALSNGVRRPQPIAAMGYEESYAAINYGLLANSFVENATKFAKENSVSNSLLLDTELLDAQKNDTGYVLTFIENNIKKEVNCRFLILSSGAYSLTFAQRFGLGLDYSLLSAAGSFYYSSLPLRGKVYTIQQPKLPFAAIHGDVDIAKDQLTRFGPTMSLIALMEKHDYKSVLDYLKLIKVKSKLPNVIYNLLTNPMVRQNIGFDLPFLGKRLFAKQVSKIIPDIRSKHIKFANGVGGARPLLVDHVKGQLIFGETKLQTNNAIFNIAPATGASTCLNIAFSDLHQIIETLDLKGDKPQDIDQLSA